MSDTIVHHKVYKIQKKQYNGYTMYILNGEFIMTMTLTKWGNSVGVRLSPTTLRKAGLHVGDKVEAEYQEGVGVVLRLAAPKIRPRVDLAAMLERITPDSLHDASEFDTKPIGSEVW